MSKTVIFKDITADETSAIIDRTPGKAAVFIRINPVGHGRVKIQSSADGGVNWVPCKAEDGSDSIFNEDCFCGLQEHGGNTVLRFIADQTSGSTTGITVYITIDE